MATLMDKEKIVTISIGLLIGLLAAGGYFFFFKDLNHSQSQKPTTIQSKPTKPDANPVISGAFSWDAPQNALITSEKVASVSGTASAGSKIILLSNADQDSVVVGTDGKFSVSLNLEDGENKINLTYLETNKPPVTIVRQVFLEI